MKYIFSGDLDNVCITLQSDPDEVDRSVAFCWPKAEFYQLTGILVPDDVESMSIEPSRNIYALKYEDQNEAQIFFNPVTAPSFMVEIWAAREEIRMHAKAAWLEGKDEDGYVYHYDPQLDQIVQEEHPEREHILALGQLSKYKMTARVVVDLIDLLVQKGVITEGELPAYFDLTQAKDLMSKINWSNM